jgi:hypothetical protein
MIECNGAMVQLITKRKKQATACDGRVSTNGALANGAATRGNTSAGISRLIAFDGGIDYPNSASQDAAAVTAVICMVILSVRNVACDRRSQKRTVPGMAAAAIGGIISDGAVGDIECPETVDSSALALSRVGDDLASI